MRRWLWSPVLFLSLLLMPQGAFAQLSTGAWKVNMNGFEGHLVIKSVIDGKVEGTVDNQPIVGLYDDKIRRLNFVRIMDRKKPGEVQAFTGYLFTNAVGNRTRYTLAGTFCPYAPSGVANGMLEAGWYAQITK